MTSLPLNDAPGAASPRRLSRKPTGVDAAFVNVSRSVAASVLVITGGIGIFLAYQSLPTLRHYGLHFFTTQSWNPEADKLGIAAILVGTFEVALVAMLLAFPLAITTALYITEYAPPKLRSTFVAAVDLMAAVPSIVYGLWGFFLIMPHANTFALFLQRTFTPLMVNGLTRDVLLGVAVVGIVGGILARFVLGYRRAALVPLGVAALALLALVPLLMKVGADPNAAVPDATRYQASAFIAGVVVSMMATPMACSIMRQVFSQTPEGEKEGALALGSTRWGMLRTVVLPFGKGGIIGGTMLALGRALGETMAVVLIISPEYLIKLRPLEIGTSTVSSTIALQFGEANGIQLSALLAAGFALFVITLVVNTFAAIIVSRSRSGADN